MTMDEEIYKIGETYRFSIAMPGNKIFFYEGEIKTITSDLIVLHDKKLDSEVIIYIQKIIAAEKKQPFWGEADG